MQPLFFLDLTDPSKQLDRDERVNLVLSTISDLRSVYIQLKQEVASIDRRRKRARKKQRLGMKTILYFPFRFYQLKFA